MAKKAKKTKKAKKATKKKQDTLDTKIDVYGYMIPPLKNVAHSFGDAYDIYTIGLNELFAQILNFANQSKHINKNKRNETILLKE